MANNGYKGWTRLVEYDIETGELTGRSKVNTSSDPHYVAPVYNEAFCPLPVIPNTPPVITLLGANPYTMTAGTTYVEPGYTAEDQEDGSLTGAVVVVGTVNTNTAGTYSKTYSVKDTKGLSDSKTRTIIVEAAPVVVMTEVNVDGYPDVIDMDYQAIVTWKFIAENANHTGFTLKYNTSKDGAGPVLNTTTVAAGVTSINAKVMYSKESKGDYRVALELIEGPGYTRGLTTTTFAVVGKLNV